MNQEYSDDWRDTARTVAHSANLLCIPFLAVAPSRERWVKTYKYQGIVFLVEVDTTHSAWSSTARRRPAAPRHSPQPAASLKPTSSDERRAEAVSVAVVRQQTER